MSFYITFESQHERLTVPVIERRGIPIMTTATGRYSAKRGHFLLMKRYDTKRIVDSGGYTVMDKWGEYPWTVEEYHEWLMDSCRWFEWAAAMDLACEEAFDDILTVDERVDRTIDNTIAHFDLDPPYRVMPVLQGRSLEKYVECYDRLKDHGIPVERGVGLGTVCRIASSTEILKLEMELEDRIDTDHIHGFGVKISALEKGSLFDSMDSAAWTSPLHGGKKYVGWDSHGFNKEPYEDSATATLESMVTYYERATELMERNKRIARNGGTSLRELSVGEVG